MVVIVVVLTMMLGNIIVNAQTLEQTPTGFYYPTGTSELGDYAAWLEEPPPNGTYFPGFYHIGWDIATYLWDPVYAIADGEILDVGDGGWGDDNVGLFILHTLQDGTEFVAVYGHVRSGLGEGDEVKAGEEIAIVGPWSYGIHLHFGVHPGGDMPPDPYGALELPVTPPYNGWVDPIAWIVQNTPGKFYEATYADQTPIYPPGLDYYPVAPGQVLNVSFTFKFGS